MKTTITLNNLLIIAFIMLVFVVSVAILSYFMRLIFPRGYMSGRVFLWRSILGILMAVGIIILKELNILPEKFANVVFISFIVVVAISGTVGLIKRN